MPSTRSPRKGSLQYWPRKRARRSYARIRTWFSKTTDPKPLGFAGYKVGMTHLMIKDNNERSLTKGQNINFPITIIECPPIKVASLRFYKNSVSGLHAVFDVFAENLDKELERKILNKKGNKITDVKDYDDVRLVVYTQPKLTGIGKKKPEVFEVHLSGEKEAKLEYAKSVLGKEIKINDVLEEGQQVDIHSVTRGKGLQGPVRRFGIGLKSHKSEKHRRTPGNLGAWTGGKMWTVAQSGKTGYYQRRDYNKWLIKIGEDKEINPKSGFPHYGVIKNQYIFVKGSVGGSQKRIIIMTNALRENKKIPKAAPEIVYTNIN